MPSNATVSGGSRSCGGLNRDNRTRDCNAFQKCTFGESSRSTTGKCVPIIAITVTENTITGQSNLPRLMTRRTNTTNNGRCMTAKTAPRNGKTTSQRNHTENVYAKRPANAAETARHTEAGPSLVSVTQINGGHVVTATRIQMESPRNTRS